MAEKSVETLVMPARSSTVLAFPVRRAERSASRLKPYGHQKNIKQKRIPLCGLPDAETSLLPIGPF